MWQKFSYGTGSTVVEKLMSLPGPRPGSIRFYTPPEMMARARDADFKDARHVPGTLLGDRYFAEGPGYIVRYSVERIGGVGPWVPA